MNGLARRASDCANWEALGNWFMGAVVALGCSLFDNLYLTIKACGSALDKRNISCETHFVNMPSCIQIIQRIENNIESFEPLDVKIVILDVRMVCF